MTRRTQITFKSCTGYQAGKENRMEIILVIILIIELISMMIQIGFTISNEDAHFNVHTVAMQVKEYVLAAKEMIAHGKAIVPDMKQNTAEPLRKAQAIYHQELLPLYHRMLGLDSSPNENDQYSDAKRLKTEAQAAYRRIVLEIQAISKVFDPDNPPATTADGNIEYGPR